MLYEQLINDYHNLVLHVCDGVEFIKKMANNYLNCTGCIADTVDGNCV